MAFGPSGCAQAGLGVAGGIGATIARIDSLGEEFSISCPEPVTVRQL
jgi:hypothetical protein